MDYQLTSVDIHFLLKELNKELADAKVDKIYQKDKRGFLIGFHVQSEGKKLLRLDLPGAMFLTDMKEDMPEPAYFCMFLRKNLTGSFLRSIKQLDFERIVDFTFDVKGEEMHLIAEFFSKGNLILADKDYIIKSLLEPQKWKDRTLRGNVKYEHPKKQYDASSLSREGFSECIGASSKDSIVKVLAMDLGLGGRYAEEVCFRAGIEKQKYKIDEAESVLLYDSLKSLLDEEISATIVGEMPYPISFRSIEGDKKTMESFSRAIDELITGHLIGDAESLQAAPFLKEKKKLLMQIAQQEEQIKKMQEDADEFQKKAEFIYSNYNRIEPIIRELSIIIKKYSQDEIRKKLKDHPVVSELNFAEKTVQLEL